MAQWIAINTTKVSLGKGTFMIREGDIIDDGLYNLATLQAAGCQFMPSTDTAAAAAQAFAKKQARKGNRDDARIAQPWWAAPSMVSGQRMPVVRTGQVTIAGTNTTGVLTFSGAAEPDVNYTVSCQPVAIGGTANLALCDVQQITKTTGNLTLTLQASPGAGNSVTFDVTVTR